MNEKETKELATREEQAPAVRRERPMIPPVDIYETEDGLILVADMPGVTKESVEVKIEENVLQMKGEIVDLPAEDVQPLYAELRGNEYFRAFTIGPEFDLDKVEASMDAGVLRIFLPKVETQKPKKIEIKVA
ncbi:heat shock protein Hsp20 [Thermodesulfatator indicus DSM 15286]|uniref:Heat shock protein Hsp20 n=1 Tax=Thermodesulfatator indicus (strain DSM 15286 / JCM 11887 / CIR29812) TaxID=667014 RepID=F8AB42_THEID|nr:Hsp20/alpha crystallin family protein [Thermodesulfatator indicus]AEH44413.1 heat shock protein Hsp20 [Thermodesulfatator indicus DSM 15286]